MKQIGSILLAIGFLAGAFVTVAQENQVNWTQYGVCAASMLAGLVALRAARASELEAGGDQHQADLGVLERSLESLIARVRGLENDTTDEQQLVMHERIDAELMEDINTFVEARESMIPSLGMQSYANVMSPFAAGERQLNRAWSASADGYVDEVRRCVSEARRQLEQAGTLLKSARA